MGSAKFQKLLAC